MVSELENIKEIEEKLLKVRLEITEKVQEEKEKEKAAGTAATVSVFTIFAGLFSLALENKLISIIPFSIGFLLLVFWYFPKAKEGIKLVQAINLAKTKKKQLEDRLKALSYLAKVKAKKEQS